MGKQARIAGVLKAMILLGPDAAVARISTEWNSSFKRREIQSAVEKCLRASMFRTACAGKEAELVFNFVLAESGPPGETKFSFGFPNQFWISAPPTMVQP